MAEPEQFEHIPWNQLLEAPKAGRKTAYWAAAVVGLIALGVSIVKVWPAAPGSIESPLSQPVTVPSSPSHLYTEAELRAPTVVEIPYLAAVAEWFVADYFTIDGTEEAGESVRRWFPDGWPLPVLPQIDPDRRSFVEWTRTITVEERASEYRAVVTFRVLTARRGENYQRMPVRAVAVRLAVSGADVSILDLPEPHHVPSIARQTAALEEQTPPPEITEQALANLDGWGTEPRVESAWKSDSGWRIVVSVTDELGNRWPLSRTIADRAADD